MADGLVHAAAPVLHHLQHGQPLISNLQEGWFRGLRPQFRAREVPHTKRYIVETSVVPIMPRSISEIWCAGVVMGRWVGGGGGGGAARTEHTTTWFQVGSSLVVQVLV